MFRRPIEKVLTFVLLTKAPMGTIKYNNCNIYNRTIDVFKSQIQYNSTIAVVQLVQFPKFKFKFYAKKALIL